MFGMQRVGDLVWAAADSRTRGFLCGGTAGRTTLAGEGLQHQDGHSHLFSLAVPNLLSYDPAFAYEIAVIIEDGIRRMYREGESVFYYITLMNELYEMLPMPDGARDGILKGMYRLRTGEPKKDQPRAHLLGSGAILNEALKAQQMLAGYNVSADVWSVTSFQELYRDGHAVERWNRLHPGEKPSRAVCGPVPGRRHGRHRCRVGLRQGASRWNRSLAAAPHRCTWHRRLRTQRGAGGTPRFLRSGCTVHHRRRPE